MLGHAGNVTRSSARLKPSRSRHVKKLVKKVLTNPSLADYFPPAMKFLDQITMFLVGAFFAFAYGALVGLVIILVLT
jgi:hypothetical protein